MSDRKDVSERRGRIVRAVAARLPGAVPRARADRLLRILEDAGYEVVEAEPAHPRGAVDPIERLRRENDDLRQVNARLVQAEKDAVAARVAAEDALYDQQPRGAVDDE